MKNTVPLLYVIVHGSWQSSLGWQKAAALLEEKDQTVLLVDLPGHGKNIQDDFSQIHLNTYVDFVVDQLKKHNHQEIILIGHSMGGMVISQVAEQFPVKKLIYVTAFFPVDGECLIDMARRSTAVPGLGPYMIFDKNKKTITLEKKGLDQVFYNDCNPECITNALDRLQPEPLLPFHDKVTLTPEKFGKIPKVYIECTEDQTINLELQRFMNHRWPCQIYSLPAGHYPFYSMPEKLIEVILSFQ